MKVRRVRTRKQLLDNFTKTRVYCKLIKNAAIVRTGNWGFINVIRNLSPLLWSKFLYLLESADIFKITILVYDGRIIVTTLYSSL